jgi:hypothetical protein
LLRAFLLVSQTSESGLTELLPGGLAGKSGVEAAAAKPQEDGSGGRSAGGLLAGTSSLLGKELLATSCLLSSVSGLLVKELLTMSSLLAGVSGLLVKKLLTTSSLLAGASSLLVKEPLTTSSLLSSASGLLVNELLAMALVFPQVIDLPLPIPVGAVRTSTGPNKNGPPKRGRRQQAEGLLILSVCALEPFLIAKGMTNASLGVVEVENIEYPVGGAWGRLQPFVVQPPDRIGEGGRGQMGRQ